MPNGRVERLLGVGGNTQFHIGVDLLALEPMGLTFLTCVLKSTAIHEFIQNGVAKTASVGKGNPITFGSGEAAEVAHAARLRRGRCTDRREAPHFAGRDVDPFHTASSSMYACLRASAAGG